MPLAYSYVRFSNTKQAEGDSLRRQTEAAAAYCQRHSLTLDTDLSLRDLGVSAFRGSNAAVGTFRTFLDAVGSGRVKPGSVLIVESFDRISRQGIDEGYDLIKGILKAGVRIVTLSPEREFDASATKSLSRGALEIQLILERAAEESETKSKRVAQARAKGRERARRGEVVTKRVPVWLRVENKKIVPDPAKVKLVKRLVKMTVEGVGLTEIAAQMNAKQVPVMGYKVFEGRAVVWSATMVWKVVTSRALLGEYQPFSGVGRKRQPDGPVIPDYYPRVVEPEEFAAARAALGSRHQVGRGRRGKVVNLFAGLLKDARGGGTFAVRSANGRERSYVAVGGTHGRGDAWASFPFEAFEGAVLLALEEVTVEPPGAAPATRSAAVRAQIANLDELLAKWRAKMDRTDLVDVVADKLVQLGAERRAALTRLAEAEAAEGDSLSDALREVRTVRAALAADNSDENRLRCRQAVRRAVESVWCLFPGGRGWRAAAVQVRFKGGAGRSYLIGHRPGGRSRFSPWAPVTEVRSLAVAEMPGLGGELDLREKAHVAATLGLLQGLTRETFSAPPGGAAAPQGSPS